MLRETFFETHLGNPGLHRPVMSYRRVVIGALYGFSGVLAVGMGMNAAAFIDLIHDLFSFGLPGTAMHYLLISCLNIAFDLSILAVFLAFVLTAGRHAEFFSKRQSLRLLALGFLNAASTVAGLLMPRYTTRTNVGEWLAAQDEFPELDLESLMFSMMFFALAGVFEYARILQEDSDSIL